MDAPGILERVTVEPGDNGCWLWNQSIGTHGYGQTWHNEKVTVAHRVAYELFVGPIPAGMMIHHRCGVRTCCNPTHLEAMTQSQHGHHHGQWCPPGPSKAMSQEEINRRANERQKARYWATHEKPAPIPCAWCRTVFTPWRAGVKFCKPYCKTADYRRRKKAS